MDWASKLYKQLTKAVNSCSPLKAIENIFTPIDTAAFTTALQNEIAAGGEGSKPEGEQQMDTGGDQMDTGEEDSRKRDGNQPPDDDDDAMNVD